MGGVYANNQASVTRAGRGTILLKIKNTFIASIANTFPMSMALRAKLYRYLGVRVGLNCLLGKLIIDGIYPEDIVIGNGCTITNGTVLLTHFYDTKNLGEHAYYRGKIVIGNYCYIGMNTIFSKPVTVGDGAVIGAGSVVTKDIPPYEVWAGVPAKFICRRYDDSFGLPNIENFKAK